MVYINECIDSETEFGKKYLSLVSKDDEVMATHLHHIVPVAYFKDVLGISECRKKGSPDMDKDNLVKLSVGKHLLAHYYLMKCAKKCIKAQMVNAFMCTYKTTSVDGITEEDVLARMAELDAEYASLKNGKRPHKDEIYISNGKNTHRLTRWLNGEKYGTYLIYDNKCRITDIGKYNCPIDISFSYLDSDVNEYEKRELTGGHEAEYTDGELYCIGVRINKECRFGITPTSFSVWEMREGENPRLIQFYKHYYYKTGSDVYTYSFRTLFGDSPLDGILPTDTTGIETWLAMSAFSTPVYEVIAFVMSLITQSKDACPHLYENMSKNPILNELTHRAPTKSADIAEMFDSVNKYVDSKVLPSNLGPRINDVSIKNENYVVPDSSDEIISDFSLEQDDELDVFDARIEKNLLTTICEYIKNKLFH